MHPCTKQHAYHGIGLRQRVGYVDPEYMVKDADDKPIVTYNAFKNDPRVKSGKSIDNEGFGVN